MNFKFLSGSILFLIMVTSTCFAQDTIYMRNDQRIACNIVEVNATEVKYKKLELSDGPLYIENKALIAQVKYKNGFIDVFPEIKIQPTQPAKKTEDDYVQDRNTKKTKNDDYISNRQGNKLIVLGPTHYLYGDKRLNENGMQRLLLSVNDPQITKEIKRAKMDKGLKYIGFAAIPLLILGAAFASQISISPVGTNYPNNNTNNNDEYIAPTMICVVGAAASFSASIYFGIDRKGSNARAICLYQQKYEGQ